jgi:hypothetical protein
MAASELTESIRPPLPNVLSCCADVVTLVSGFKRPARGSFDPPRNHVGESARFFPTLGATCPVAARHPRPASDDSRS